MLGQRAAGCTQKRSAASTAGGARSELTAIVDRNSSLTPPPKPPPHNCPRPILSATGSNDETRRTREAALAGCIQAGDRRCEILARVQLAVVAGREGKLPEAIRAADAALADARAIGDRWAEGYVLSQRLALYNWAHDDTAARESLEPTLAALRESGNRRVLMGTLTNATTLAIEELDLERAEAYIVEAERLARRVGSQLASALVDGARGSLERTRGDADLARKSYTAAIEKGRGAGVPRVIAEYLSRLAWLELEDDRPDAAAESAQAAIAQYNAIGDTRNALYTEGVLAWSDARRGDAAGARRRLVEAAQGAAEDRRNSRTSPSSRPKLAWAPHRRLAPRDRSSPSDCAYGHGVEGTGLVVTERRISPKRFMEPATVALWRSWSRRCFPKSSATDCAASPAICGRCWRHRRARADSLFRRGPTPGKSVRSVVTPAGF